MHWTGEAIAELEILAGLDLTITMVATTEPVQAAVTILSTASLFPSQE